MGADSSSWRALGLVERVGRATAGGVAALGFAAQILVQAAGWLLLGRVRGKPVRSGPVFAEMMDVGIRALPIMTLLSFTIGVMLAIQGIDALRPFGAEDQVVLGVALSVTREFAPLIGGILMAGRSGSALAARLGTMTIRQELDALEVMGIDPVRFLVVPALVAMILMLPALTLVSDLVGLAGAGLYVTGELGMPFAVYVDQTLQILSIDDLVHGLTKSLIFGVLITLVGVVDGVSVRGGAEGVGRVTTAAVVHGIVAIIVTDMLFVFLVTRA
jgi:phospholipid/cholesterol/gamma-HCH transport system permease protein